MKVYKAKTHKIRGTSYREIYKKAFRFYNLIISRTKRKPYIRPAYFKGEKIFLDLFWPHIQDKNQGDKKRRIPYLPLAIELIENSHHEPEMKKNPNKPSELLYCFKGIDDQNNTFCVQIKQNKNVGRKWLMSAYPK